MNRTTLPPKEPAPIRGATDSNPAYRIPLEMREAADNPLIQALPAPWDWDDKDCPILDKLTTYLSIDREALKEMSSIDRLFQLVQFKAQFFQVLKRHRDLEQSLCMAIRFGYLSRNPMALRYRRTIHDRIQEFQRCMPARPQPADPFFIAASNLGFALLGSPGLGKTTSIARILRLYPQVILHKKEGFQHTQVVWLFLTCPHDRSTRALCLAFFQEIDGILGTQYFREYFRESEGVLLAGMANVAAVLSLGVLVIDEIQFLKGGKDDMLKFLVQLENALGIPVVRIGTHRATNLLAGNPHQARRSVGIGGQVWNPLSKEDPEWKLFLEALWDHQFLRNHADLTPELAETMYEETQGVLTYAVDLFYFAQHNAINDSTEIITADSLRRAAQDNMAFNRPYIHALRSRDPDLAELLEDIVGKDFEQSREFFEGQLLLPSKSARSAVSTVPSKFCNDSEIASGSGIPGFHPTPALRAATSPAVSPKRPTRKKKAFPPGSIMAICEAGAVEDNLAPYEALKKAGVIQNISGFLSAGMAE